MKGLREEELVSQVVEWVESRNHNAGETNGRIESGTDLLAEGILDSVGFVELLTFIEEQTGRQMDLADLDPEEFAKIGGLCRHAMASAN